MTTVDFVCAYQGRADECPGCGGFNETGGQFCSHDCAGSWADRVAAGDAQQEARRKMEAAFGACSSILAELGYSGDEIEPDAGRDPDVTTPDTPQTGTGALEAAIRAVDDDGHQLTARGTPFEYRRWSCSCGASRKDAPVNHWIEIGLAAAAPIIEREALERAAAAVAKESDLQSSWFWHQLGETNIARVATWLRERAKGGTDGE